MINDKSLENHLNSVKEGKEIPKPINPEYKWAPQIPGEKSNPNVKSEIFLDLYRSLGKILSVLIISLLYGYGIDALSGQDWNFLQIFGIGIIFNHSISVFPYQIKNILQPKQK